MKILIILLFSINILFFDRGLDSKKIHGCYDFGFYGVVLNSDSSFCFFGEKLVSTHYSIGNWCFSGDTLILKNINLEKDSLKIVVDIKSFGINASLIKINVTPVPAFFSSVNLNDTSINYVYFARERGVVNEYPKSIQIDYSIGIKTKKIILPKLTSGILDVYSNAPPSIERLINFEGYERRFVLENGNLRSLNEDALLGKKIYTKKFRYSEELKLLLSLNMKNIFFYKNYKRYFVF